MIINKGVFHFIIFFVYIRRMQIFRFTKDEIGSLGQAVAVIIFIIVIIIILFLDIAWEILEKRFSLTLEYFCYAISMVVLGARCHCVVGRGVASGLLPLAPPPPSAIPWVAMIRIKDTPPPSPPSYLPFSSSSFFFSSLLPSSLPLLLLAPLPPPSLHTTLSLIIYLCYLSPGHHHHHHLPPFSHLYSSSSDRFPFSHLIRIITRFHLTRDHFTFIAVVHPQFFSHICQHLFLPEISVHPPHFISSHLASPRLTSPHLTFRRSIILCSLDLKPRVILGHVSLPAC